MSHDDVSSTANLQEQVPSLRHVDVKKGSELAEGSPHVPWMISGGCEVPKLQNSFVIPFGSGERAQLVEASLELSHLTICKKTSAKKTTQVGAVGRAVCGSKGTGGPSFGAGHKGDDSGFGWSREGPSLSAGEV